MKKIITIAFITAGLFLGVCEVQQHTNQQMFEAADSVQSVNDLPSEH